MGTRVVLVFGPPGSGKTTYVRDRFKPGDLVVDFDVLYAALSGLPMYEKPPELVPFVCAARDAVLKRILRPNDVPAAWVITSEPRRKGRAVLRRLLGDPEFVEVMADAGECLARIGNDPARSNAIGRWRGVVSTWFEMYEKG